VLIGEGSKISVDPTIVVTIPPQCSNAQVLQRSSSGWQCADTPVLSLSCSSGQVAKSDGTNGWYCADDLTTAAGSATLGSLTCRSGEVPQYDGSTWACVAAYEDADAVEAVEAQSVSLAEGTTVGGLGIARVIATDTSIPVADCAGLLAALADLDRSIIAGAAVVTIEIADGTSDCADTIRVRHANGDRIAIVGNTGDPGQVVLRFAGVDGVAVRDNRSLSLLDGVTLRGNLTGKGVLAIDGGFIRLGPNVIVEEFDWGLSAEFAGRIRAEGVIVRNNAFFGVAAREGGMVQAAGAQSIQNGSFGFTAVHGALIVANDALAEGNGYMGPGSYRPAAGISAFEGGKIVANDASAIANGGSGFSATRGAYLTTRNPTSMNNGASGAGFGFIADDWSALAVGAAANVTVSGNAEGDYSIAPLMQGARGQWILSD
jgi:hypothetical protein